MEEQYVQSLKRLSQFRVPNAQSELGYVMSSYGHRHPLCRRKANIRVPP